MLSLCQPGCRVSPTSTKFRKGIRWVPTSKHCPLLYRVSLNLVTYHHEVAQIPISKVSQESCSVSAQVDPLKNRTLPPIPAWVKQLTRLPFLLVYVKFPFFAYFRQSVIVGFHQLQCPASTVFWKGIPWVCSSAQFLTLSPESWRDDQS